MRWVVKLGSSSVTDHGQRLAEERILGWSKQIAELVAEGHQVVVVSSGAVAAGMARLGLNERPDTLARLQGIAAIGQTDLMQAWRKAFDPYQLPVAQVLLNHSDISNRERYLNARAAINLLLSMPAVPIVNENDSVATDEIRLGDNDTLAALVANLIDADGVMLLTDQEGIYSANPNLNPSATLIHECDAMDPSLDAVVGDTDTKVGTGGMVTKLKAARIASRSGAISTIASAMKPDVIKRIVRNDPVGTTLHATIKPIASRKQWLADHVQIAGAVVIDAGAAEVLKEGGASLLPVGVVAVEGRFGKGENVMIKSIEGVRIGHGLSNYSSEEMSELCGMTSSDIKARFSMPFNLEAIHRDNLVVF